MQAFQLVLLASGVTLGAAWLAARFAGDPRSGEHWPGVVLGVAAGLIGVVIVAVLMVDTVPDDTEAALRGIAFVGVSAVAIIGSLYRLSRR
jgi:hypothetical protein